MNPSDSNPSEESSLHDVDDDLRPTAEAVVAMLQRRSLDVPSAARRLPEVGDAEVVELLPLTPPTEESNGRSPSRPVWAAAAVLMVIGVGIAGLLLAVGPGTGGLGPASQPDVTIVPEVEASVTSAESEEGEPERKRPESVAVINAANSALATLPDSLVGTISTVNNRTGEPVMSVSTFGVGMDAAQPSGSTQHLYTLLTALESGIGADHVIAGVGPCEPGQGGVVLENFARSKGRVDFLQSQALRSSRCSFARLETQLGTEAVAATMTRLLQREISAAGPLWHHDTRLTPTEQAQAMAAIVAAAADGDPAAEAVLSVYEENVKRGTGTRADAGSSTAGITGTREDFDAAWFVGTRGDLTTAVLIASANGEPMTAAMQPGLDRSITGGSFPAEVWGAMYESLADLSLVEPAEDRQGWKLGVSVDAGDAGEDGHVGEGGEDSQGVPQPADGCLADYPVGKDEDGDGVIDRCYALWPSADGELPELVPCPKTSDLVIFMTPNTPAEAIASMEAFLNAADIVASATWFDQAAALGEFQRLFADYPSVGEVAPGDLPPSYRVDLVAGTSEEALAALQADVLTMGGVTRTVPRPVLRDLVVQAGEGGSPAVVCEGRPGQVQTFEPGG